MVLTPRFEWFWAVARQCQLQHGRYRLAVPGKHTVKFMRAGEAGGRKKRSFRLSKVLLEKLNPSSICLVCNRLLESGPDSGDCVARTFLILRIPMKLKLAAIALLSSTAISAAADLPARPYTKAPVVSPVYNWTGFYIGVHGGYGWGNSESLNVNGTPPFPAGSVSSTDVDGWLGGGQLGFNYQFNPNWLIGIEGDVSGGDIKGNLSGFSTVAGCTTTRFQSSNLELNWLATITGRLGYIAGPALLYVKGGAAFGDFKASSTTVNPAAGNALIATVSGGETRTGWTVGAGAEWAFANNWSAKAEYNYVDFGTDSVTRDATYFVGAGPNPLLRDASTHLHLVKVGLNYRFGGF